MERPRNPISAATHQDPYAYYAELLATGVAPETLARTVAYRPSPNTRVPLFGRLS